MGERPPPFPSIPFPPGSAQCGRAEQAPAPALPSPSPSQPESGSLTWLEPGEEAAAAGEGSRGGRQGKGREGGSEPASERGKGAAGEAGGLCGGRRAKASLGSRQPPPPPHHPRAAGRLLLPLSQALGPWGSHARSGCRLAFPAAPPCEAAPRLAPPPPPPAPPGRTPAARAGLVPHASPRRSLTPSAERPPDPAAAASRPCRGAAPRRAAPRTGFVASPPSELPQRPPARPPPPTRRPGPRPRGRCFLAPGGPVFPLPLAPSRPSDRGAEDAVPREGCGLS
ncbi:proline-rich protein 2-like [Corvus hawaiiensis]|uniref:proline-rich protein 2-like n=1 Tax=Corvus hawaiiensis TaxID=134902 RepID=UPI00201A1B69|nr:proline-rich protein 2-like [Corvus hawaiiensis]